jgi:hypothetical protein
VLAICYNGKNVKSPGLGRGEVRSGACPLEHEHTPERLNSTNRERHVATWVAHASRACTQAAPVPTTGLRFLTSGCHGGLNQGAQVLPRGCISIFAHGLRFLTSGCHGGLNQGRRFPHEGASRCGALSVVQTDTGSGNTVEKAHTKRSEKAGSGSERIRDMNMRPGGIEGARTRGGPPREEDGGRQNLNKPDRRP